MVNIFNMLLSEKKSELYNEIQNAEYVANNDNIVSAQINYQIGALKNAIETAEVEIVKTKIDDN